MLDFNHVKESMEGSDIVIHAAGIAGISSMKKADLIAALEAKK